MASSSTSASLSLSSSSSSDVVQKLLTIFDADDTASKTPNFLASLPSTALSLVISALFKPPYHPRRISLLRALWTHHSVRVSVILNFAHHANNDITNRQSTSTPSSCSTQQTQFMEEIGFLLAANARDHTKPVDQRLNAISSYAAAIARRSHKQSPSSLDVPLLILCAQASAAVGSHDAHAVNEQIIKFFILQINFLFRHHRQYCFQGIVVMLDAELGLSPDQQTALMEIVEQFSTSTACTSQIMVLLTRSLLTYVANLVRGHGHGQMVNRILLVVLHLIRRTSSSNTVNDLLVVLEVFIHDHPTMALPLIRTFSSLLSASSSNPLLIAQTKQQFAPVHLMFLFSLLNIMPDESSRAALNNLLETVLINDDLNFDFSQVASSSSSIHTPYDSWKYAAFQECVTNTAMRTRCDVLLRFSQGLMWRTVRLRKWAVFMLVEIFINFQSCRESLLRIMFACMTETETTPLVMEAFTKIFVGLAHDTRAQVALIECHNVLIDILRSFTFIPVAIACKTIPAFIPTAMHVPTLLDALLIFLRKMSGSRAQAHQHVACSGFIALLSHRRITNSVAEEIAKALVTLLDIAHPLVQSSLLLQLLKAVMASNFPFDRVRVLSEYVASRLCVTQQNSYEGKELPPPPPTKTPQITITPLPPLRKQQHALDLSSFFSVEDGKHVVRDHIPLLLRFCASIRGKCQTADKIFKRFVTYLEHEDGAIVDASASDKCETPPSSRISLLCSLLQTVFFFSSTAGNATESYGNVDNQLSIFGVSIILRDFLLSKEGSNLSKTVDASRNLVYGEQGWSDRNQVMTAREGSCARNKNMHIDRSDLHSIPMEFVVRALQSMDRLSLNHQNNVLFHMVRLELTQTARQEVQRVGGNASSVNNDRGSSPHQLWCKDLLKCIRSSLIQTCPWTEEDEDKFGRNGPMFNSNGNSDHRDALASSRSTESTVNNSSSQWIESEATKSGMYTALLKKLQVRNDTVETAFRKTRLNNLNNSARISLRESCMKMVLTLLSKRMIDNKWQFILSLCKECLHGNQRIQTEEERVTGKNGLDPSLPTEEEEDDNVTAINVLSKLFRTEFASSMSVGLTSSYLELMYILLEQIGDDDDDDDDDDATTGNGSSKVMKKEISSTLMHVLREYSVQHVGLMRQMVKVLLKSFDEKEAVRFGAHVLEWLGNHVALIDSRYSGSGDVRVTHIGVGEFDEDIFEEALRMEEGIDDVENEDDEEQDSQNNRADRHANGEKTSSKSSMGIEIDECLRSSSTPDVTALDPIQSLCLNETADGSVASICCVLALFTGVVQKGCRKLRQFVRSERSMQKRSVTEITEQMSKVVDGVLTFVRSEFVTNCLQAIPSSSNEGGVGGKSNGAGWREKRETKRKTKRRVQLAWPMEMQNRFAAVLLNLMDLVDVQLRLLSRGLLSSNDDGRNTDIGMMIGTETEAGKVMRKNYASVGRSCVKTMGLVFEEENSLATMHCMREERSKQWAIEERIENVATSLVGRWERRDEKATTTRRHRKSNVDEGSCDGNKENDDDDLDDIGTVAGLAKRLFLCTGQASIVKKRRIAWRRENSLTGDNKTGGSSSLSGQKRKMDEVADDSEREEMDDNGDDGIRILKTNKRYRMRSRNAWVDQYMLEDNEQENFVDLESFVVQMNEEL